MKRRKPQMGLAGLGIELTAAVVGGLLLGVWIDRQYDTGPWAALIGGMIGVVGGLYNLIRQAQRAMEQSSGGDDEKGGP